MEGHVVGSLLPSDAANGAWQKLHNLPLPSIALLISGGHTELVSIKMGGKGVFRYEIIGQTKDDAVGEAFDKAARLLGLPYPGGPHIARLAQEAVEAEKASRHRGLHDAMGVFSVKLPRPMIKSGDLDFSFSGLKTAVLYAVRDAEKAGITGDKAKDSAKTEAWKRGLAREFENAVADVLDSKLRSAIDKIGAQSVIIGGGVAANHVLRARFEKDCKRIRCYHFHAFTPHIRRQCSDDRPSRSSRRKAPGWRPRASRGRDKEIGLVSEEAREPTPQSL